MRGPPRPEILEVGLGRRKSSLLVRPGEGGIYAWGACCACSGVSGNAGGTIVMLIMILMMMAVVMLVVVVA